MKAVVATFMLIEFSACTCTNYCLFWQGASGLSEPVKAQKSSLKFDNCSICGPELDFITKPDSNGNTMAGRKGKPDIPGEIFSNVITAGPTFSTMSTDGEMGYEAQKKQAGVGVQVGFGTSLPISTKFSLAPTIRFKQLSASETTSYSSPGGASTKYKNTSTYNYIGGNLLAQFRVANSISLVAGPEVNYLLSASEKSGGTSDIGGKEKITNESNRVAIDLLAGIKYDIPAGNKQSKWGLSLIYDHTLSRVNKKQVGGYDVPAAKVNSLQLGIAYFWRRTSR